MKLVYTNKLEKSSYKSRIPVVSTLTTKANRREVMNGVLWKNAIVYMSKKLEKELDKEGHNYNEIVREDKKVIIDLTDETFKLYFHNIVPHFESYDEYKNISNKAFEQSKAIKGRIKKVMKKINKKHYDDAMSTFREEKDKYKDHPLYSRNGYWLYNFAMIDIKVSGWYDTTKIQDTILGGLNEQ